MGILDILQKLIFGNFFGNKGVSEQTLQKIRADWETIKSLLKQKSPSHLKQAVITADKTLDAVLKDTVVGETMGERLKNAKDKFDPITYNKIWEAHKVRNNIAHETGYDPPHYIFTDAVEKIRQGLSCLGVYV